MQHGVNRIQTISQIRLNGRPSTSGSTRSQKPTEKHMATNGTSASASARADGVFICVLPCVAAPSGAGLYRGAQLAGNSDHWVVTWGRSAALAESVNKSRR